MSWPREGERSRPEPAVAIRQDQSCPVTRLTVGRGLVRFLFDPSHDSKTSGEPGQDFVAFRHGADRFAFALCDGVGASFLGNLAAHYLGLALVEWLWAQPAEEMGARFEAGLSRLLHDLVPDARDWIERYPLPPSLPPLLQSVLDEKRAYGSETMFVCGHVTWPARTGGTVALATLGDSELQIVDPSGRVTHRTGSQQERWSTHRGPRGQVRTYLLPAREVARVIAYSDGLRSLARDLHRLSDDALDAAVARLGQQPLSDDVSLVDVVLDPRDMVERRGGAAASRGSHPHPPPVGAPRFVTPVDRSVIRPGAMLRWTEVPDARSYLVQQATTADFDPQDVVDEEVRDPWVTVQERVAGSYCYRVRALLAGMESEWSSPLHVRIDASGR
jgi:hypothetical protein